MCKGKILKKCIHGKTQNANESFNGTIWNRIPKATHVGLSTLCSGVYDAVSHLKYGQKAALDTIRLFDIDPGICMTKSCGSINEKRNINPSISHYQRRKTSKNPHILQKSVMTKLLNKKEPLMKQGFFETFCV